MKAFGVIFDDKTNMTVAVRDGSLVTRLNQEAVGDCLCEFKTLFIHCNSSISIFFRPEMSFRCVAVCETRKQTLPPC